ncbi:hypothetical protein, partial [Vibrio anguillarum]|uniref:hypothetical protein n=1 Tax=Vibrio anguillarum TaxID=55601 RepID=UPI001AD82C54
SDERSMLGGRVDAEGYFADEFTAKSNPTQSRNNKYVMTIYCLSPAMMVFTVQFKPDLADKNSFCLTPA